MKINKVLKGSKLMNQTIILEHHFLTDEEKRAICSWKYEGDHEIYNLPSYEEMKEKQMGFMNPKSEKNYRAYYDHERFVGFTNLLEEDHEVFVGIGVNPSYCNQHYGQTILKEAYLISKYLYPDKPLYLEVRTWNQRAIQCYLKAGFKIDGEPYEQQTSIGLGTFYRMMKE